MIGPFEYLAHAAERAAEAERFANSMLAADVEARAAAEEERATAAAAQAMAAAARRREAESALIKVWRGRTDGLTD
jgi:hypothetical protein